MRRLLLAVAITALYGCATQPYITVANDAIHYTVIGALPVPIYLQYSWEFYGPQ